MYSKKLVDLWEARGNREYELDDIMLLKVGRHIRPKPHFKVIVSREEGEDHCLAGYRHAYISLHATSHKGPTALIDGTPTQEDVELAAQIVARYGQGKHADTVTTEVRFPDGDTKSIEVKPMPAHDIQAEWQV